MIKILIASICGILFISASALAEYSQTQNKVDDKMNTPKVPVQPNSSDKKDNVTTKQNSDKNDVDMRNRKEMDKTRQDTNQSK
ncbi:hypothetical protein [Nitrosomonas ureae]|uniref:Pentapeptide MXKDX repeat protein n=1 Tax=Nitrosomonas ureae TaxID=44577 RepID=A0A286AMC5_9PROT|nr:hypothetical protein [Nitrosomonas ureae]SOD23039.1 hypothetical protein SAMN06297164_3663 [Nitrosomonas ureae]